MCVNTIRRQMLRLHAVLTIIYNAGMRERCKQLCREVVGEGGEADTFRLHVRPDETPMKLCIVDYEDGIDDPECDADESHDISMCADADPSKDVAPTKLLNSI